MSSATDETLHLPRDRLANALDVSVPDLEQVLVAVGVDTDYLVRALYDGDPQATFPAVAERLACERSDVVLAVVKALVAEGHLAPAAVPDLLDAAFRHVQDGPVVRERAGLAHARRSDEAPFANATPTPAAADAADGRAGDGAEAEAVARFMGDNLPRYVRRARASALVTGAAALVLGILGFVRPELFRVTLLVLAAGALSVLGVSLLYASWRLHHASRRLRAFGDALGP